MADATRALDLRAHRAMTQRVLAELAGGFLDAMLERDEVPADPFASALERSRAVGIPEDVARGWGAPGRAAHERRAIDVLKRLGRDLLTDVVRYARRPADVVEDGAAPTPRALAVAGEARAMPSLGRGSDGRWRPRS